MSTKTKLVDHYEMVCEEFGSLFNDENTSDIVLIINQKPLYCHKVFLKSRSILFKEKLKDDTKTFEITSTEFDYESFVEFVRYLYTGKAIITEKNWKLLLPIASEHKNDELKALCFAQMIKGVTVDSVCSLIKLARSGKEKYYDDIFVEKCVTLIEKKPKEVFKTKDFLEFDEQTVIFILQNNKLCIEEIDLYRSLLKWGSAQIPPEDSMTDDTTGSLKKIITPKLLQYIRFPLMDVEDLVKIKKEGFLTDEVYLECLEYFILGEEPPKKYAPRGEGGQECMKWDKQYCGNMVVIGKSGKEVVFNGSSWQGAVLGVGGHLFTVKVITNSTNAMIGFSRRNFNANASNYSSNGYFMYFSGTTLYSGGQVSQQKSGVSYGGSTIQVGQTVGAKYDQKKGEISFFVDGKCLGVAYSGVTDKQLFPCVDFYTTGTKLELVKGKYK